MKWRLEHFKLEISLKINQGLNSPSLFRNMYIQFFSYRYSFQFSKMSPNFHLIFEGIVKEDY